MVTMYIMVIVVTQRVTTKEHILYPICHKRKTQSHIKTVYMDRQMGAYLGCRLNLVYM